VEYRAFKRMGPLFVRAFDFQGRSGVQTLREAMAILADLDGDWRSAATMCQQAISSAAGVAMS
jgi:hypothetical protein